MKFSLPMMTIGLFFLGMSVGTTEKSVRLGLIFGIIGIGFLFFSNEQCRNPAWLKRQTKHLIWKYWPIGS